MRLGGDAALYQKLKIIKEVRDANPDETIQTDFARELYGNACLMDFLKEISKRKLSDDFTKLAADSDGTRRLMWTQGSYIFNGLVSGSIFGGVSGNKITAIAGESSTGKTFFSLAVVKNFLDSNPDGISVVYFDTGAAVNKSRLSSRGVDLDRTVIVNVVTVEGFRSPALKAVDIYLKKPLR